jgi:hypothetical protein
MRNDLLNTACRVQRVAEGQFFCNPRRQLSAISDQLFVFG